MCIFVNMKRIFFILLIPFFVFAQDDILIGDVDCSGVVNSEDASLILQYVTSVIDTLPCSQNMNGLTPMQLEEIINMMSEQIVVGSESSINTIGPAYDLTQFTEFTPQFPQNSDFYVYYFDAIRFCSELEYDGYDDWYVPTASQLQNYLRENTSTINMDNTNSTDGYYFWLYQNDFGIGDIGGAGVIVAYYENLNFRHFWYSGLNGTNRCFCVR